ncbi:MAG: DSD1 family PLP-dependent enzyme [Alphaproteobacteria bacterium]|nr:DSD1 family PLP-dependent enzyme [Alphaproteobacteria bacterium]
MLQPLPGTEIADFDTPVLVVDIDAVQRNIEKMAAIARQAGVALRPHAKTHKSPIFARRQVVAGAVGVCCQKVGEAEVMAAGGVTDILVTNEIIGRVKLARLAGLARIVQIRTVADDAEAVAWLGKAARSAGVTIGVLVDCDLGHARTGLADPRAAAELGKTIALTDGLRFDGLQAYHGSIQHTEGWQARKAAADAANARLQGFRSAFAEARLACAIVSGAGTGTFAFQPAAAGYTEWQCGSYLFMDKEYRDAKGEDGGPYRVFEHALTVLASVVSVAGAEHCVVDAGYKSMSVDGGDPEVQGLPGWTFGFAGDEHGRLRHTAKDGAARPKLGDKVHLVPGHGDTTINLHDDYYVVSGGRLVGVWPVAARGRVR